MSVARCLTWVCACVCAALNPAPFANMARAAQLNDCRSKVSDSGVRGAGKTHARSIRVRSPCPQHLPSPGERGKWQDRRQARVWGLRSRRHPLATKGDGWSAHPLEASSFVPVSFPSLPPSLSVLPSCLPSFLPSFSLCVGDPRAEPTGVCTTGRAHSCPPLCTANGVDGQAYDGVGGRSHTHGGTARAFPTAPRAASEIRISGVSQQQRRGRQRRDGIPFVATSIAVPSVSSYGDECLAAQA
jgi:hypothetical protein